MSQNTIQKNIPSLVYRLPDRVQCALPVIEEVDVNPGAEKDHFVNSYGTQNHEHVQEEDSLAGKIFKNFLNGLLSPIAMLKNPLAWLFIIGGGLLAAFIPVTVPIMFALGLAISGGQLVNGVTKAVTAGINGDMKSFATAFEDIGAGVSGFGLGLLSVNRCGMIAAIAKGRARVMPIPGTGFINNCKEIVTLFTTRGGMKAIRTAFTYRQGIRLSMLTIKDNLKWLTLKSGTPYSLNWKDWFIFLMGYVGRFLPAWNQPNIFVQREKVFS